MRPIRSAFEMVLFFAFVFRFVCGEGRGESGWLIWLMKREGWHGMLCEGEVWSYSYRTRWCGLLPRTLGLVSVPFGSE